MTKIAEEKIIRSVFDDTPAMREFSTSNHLLGNPAALQEAWERDGYWFFRGVLDKDAVARARAEYIEVLEELDVVEPGCTEQAIHNGKSLEGFPIVMGGPPEEDPLLQRYPSPTLTEDPAVKAFFERVFGDEVFWVPNSEFHAVPPGTGRPDTRFNFVHADGPNNKSLPLRVCWIPLAPITEEIGGLALTKGLHKPHMGDFPRPSTGIQESDIPVEAWRRAEYEPGDVLIFSLESPHSGLANRSDRYFRLSMDIRGMPKSGNVPVVGNVVAIDRCAIVVEDDMGKQQVFRIDEDTFCRIYRGRLSGVPLPLDDIPELVKVGAPVYVASRNGTATFIRPQH